MKIKALSIYTKILSFFLVLLGFQSCDVIDPKDEYGTPSAKYKVKGSVVSEETAEPVKDIRVVLIEKMGDEEYTHGDTIYTNNKGEFDLELTSFPVNNKVFNLKIDDVDGDTNGSFESKTEPIEFADPQYMNGDGWYKGETTQDLGKIEIKPSSKEN